ncbi:MAG: hypothetical protein WBC51_00945 [Vicinamibacterales bacterium]
MKTLTQAAFLAWADGAGLGLDPQYPASAVLVLRPDPHQDRFWEIPAEPERRPYFILSLLELMGDWQECYAWRHLGRWPESADPLRVNDVVEWRILKGLGLPLGTADVVKFERAELDKLVTLMFSTTVFGWSVGEDLYIVPDHARYIVQTDHHNAIHVSCRSSADVDEWVRQMQERGFALPEEVPDSTFKRPDWMKGEPQS